MLINLDGTERIKIKDKGNGFKDVTISGVTFRCPDGNIKKGTIVIPECTIETTVIPECKIEIDNEFVVFPDENKVLYTVEFNEDI